MPQKNLCSKAIFTLIISSILCILKNLYLFIFMLWCVSHSRYVYHVHTAVHGGQKRHWIPGSGGKDSCELICEVWEPDPAPL